MGEIILVLPFISSLDLMGQFRPFLTCSQLPKKIQMRGLEGLLPCGCCHLMPSTGHSLKLSHQPLTHFKGLLRILMKKLQKPPKVFFGKLKQKTEILQDQVIRIFNLIIHNNYTLINFW